MKALFIVLVFLCSTANAVATVHTIQRPDGTDLTYYYEAPDAETFPVLILLQGSTCTSAFPLFDQIMPMARIHGIATLSVEKRGIKQGTTSCPTEYLVKNTFNDRVLDYLTVIASLRRSELRWNKRLGWAGGSEGGVIASLAAPLAPETTALLLFSTGGGLSMADELLLLTEKQMRADGKAQGEVEHAKESMLAQFEEIQRNPTPFKEWLSDDKTMRNTYLWWSIALRAKPVESLLSVDVPIYLVHGTEDVSTPVESADLVERAFLRAGKSNLEYHRYENMGHNPSPAALQDGMAWILWHI